MAAREDSAKGMGQYCRGIFITLTFSVRCFSILRTWLAGERQALQKLDRPAESEGGGDTFHTHPN